jgi:Spy/CpxP family protein refolding chaperone
MIRLIAAGILAAAALSAQVPGMFPWWDSPIAKDLKLTPEQTQKVREAVRGSREKLIHMRANVEASDANLGDLMNDDPVDARKVNEAIDKVVTARADLTRAVSQMSLKLRQVLTAAQWQELQRRQPHRPQAPNAPHPPNGFHGPHPPNAPQPPQPQMRGPGGPPQGPPPPEAPQPPRPQNEDN